MFNKEVVCNKFRPNPPKALLNCWPWPNEVWERLHVDFFGPANGKYFGCDSINVTKAFRNLFARFGIPRTIISDDATCFTSSEMVNFLDKNHMKQVTIPPYNPASNGAAENAVKTLKTALLKVLAAANVDTNLTLVRFLFDYRNTSQCTTGIAPATLMFGRRLRTRFDSILPNISSPIKEHVQNKPGKQRFYYKGQNDIDFILRVLVKVFNKVR